MKNYLDNLPRPFMVLAPMDDVTDTVFRQIIADTATSDLFFTEFVNVDGLQSAGRSNLFKKLRATKQEGPLIAQFWGKTPQNYYLTARQVSDGSLIAEANRYGEAGFDGMQGDKENQANRTKGTLSEIRALSTQQSAKNGIGVLGISQKQNPVACYSGFDINMGCPDKTIIKNGCCGALIENRPLAKEIIDATREGLDGKLPISVKTRVGLKTVDMSWIEFLLKQNIDMLSVHVRTVKEQSLVPAHHELFAEISTMRDKISPRTMVVGNGDVMSRVQAKILARTSGMDGMMIGRGVFKDPYVFSTNSPWQEMTPNEKISLYSRHVQLFQQTWRNNERKVHTLNKFCKVYINGFDGAKDLREKLMKANSTEDLLEILSNSRISERTLLPSVT